MRQILVGGDVVVVWIEFESRLDASGTPGIFGVKWLWPEAGAN